MFATMTSYLRHQPQ